MVALAGHIPEQGPVPWGTGPVHVDLGNIDKGPCSPRPGRALRTDLPGYCPGLWKSSRMSCRRPRGPRFWKEASRRTGTAQGREGREEAPAEGQRARGLREQRPGRRGSEEPRAPFTCRSAHGSHRPPTDEGLSQGAPSSPPRCHPRGPWPPWLHRAPVRDTPRRGSLS